MRVGCRAVRIAQVLAVLAVLIGRCDARSCGIEKVTSALNDAAGRDPSNASALSAAFIAACAGSRWNLNDALKYHQATWRPGSPTGFSCSDMHIFGGYLEGGRTVCRHRKLLGSKPCQIVSVGSNGEASFEAAVLAMAPHCSIDVLDGTLIGRREGLRRKLPSAVRFLPENFGNHSAARLGYKHVQALKIDCEGCEYDALIPWIMDVCTDQIYLELHTQGCGHTPSTACFDQIIRTHMLMSQLELWYAVYYKEPNVAYGAENTEFGLIRRIPCARGSGM